MHQHLGLVVNMSNGSLDVDVMLLYVSPALLLFPAWYRKRGSRRK